MRPAKGACWQHVFSSQAIRVRPAMPAAQRGQLFVMLLLLLPLESTEKPYSSILSNIPLESTSIFLLGVSTFTKNQNKIENYEQLKMESSRTVAKMKISSLHQCRIGFFDPNQISYPIYYNSRSSSSPQPSLKSHARRTNACRSKFPHFWSLKSLNPELFYNSLSFS
ncbi:hypothetical protein MRB53_023385 [Persea americana]|uniref:Uncharacterized protein n=1 Tax=Persea americana TaxID=3435 RepID=A0ACC2LAD7_PERAE|nr:hypothetical protein MRB53_023385 [Persea americana]